MPAAAWHAATLVTLLVDHTRPPLLGGPDTAARAQYRRAKTPRTCRHLSEWTAHPCWVKPPLLGGPILAG